MSSISKTVAEIADLCGGRLAGDGGHAQLTVTHVASVEDASEDAVTWVAQKEMATRLAGVKAAAIIGTAELLGDHARGIVVEDPESAIADVLDAFHTPIDRPEAGVHAAAVVDPSAQLGEGVAVGATAVIQAGVRIGPRTVIHEGVSLGTGVQIGADCEIHDRVVVYDRCSLGDRVIVHSGTVIGADGFGYIFRDGRHRRLQHLGTVVVEDDVEIGANTCIDRGKLGATRIGRGTKIDNLVMIAHNVKLGPLCILTAFCGMAGSARIGTGVIMGGKVGVTHGLSVGDGVRIGGNATVTGNVPAGQTLSGFYAQDHWKELRLQARIRKLPQLMDQVAALEKRVAELEGTADH